ncbi:MAG: hypothetical protein K0S65_3343 [Labilithrix sp.]|nr:hypothetical protein [Labilithrix sp.]
MRSTPLAVALLALTSFACSSSKPAAETSNEEVLAPPKSDGTEQSNTEETPADETEGTPPGSSSGGDGSYGVPDGGSGGGNGNGNGGGGGDGGGGGNGGGGGSLCQSSSVAESETNNDLASADSMPGQTGTFCGKIGSDADVDFVTFTLPANAKSFGMSQNTTSGAIKIEPSVEGEAFPFSGGNYLFKPGKPYVLKISTTGGALDYRISLTITQ